MDEINYLYKIKIKDNFISYFKVFLFVCRIINIIFVIIVIYENKKLNIRNFFFI